MSIYVYFVYLHIIKLHEHVFRTSATCCSNSWNILFEVCKSWRSASAGCWNLGAGIPQCAITGRSNNNFGVFDQHLLGVRTSSSGCSDNMFGEHK